MISLKLTTRIAVSAVLASWVVFVFAPSALAQLTFSSTERTFSTDADYTNSTTGPWPKSTETHLSGMGYFFDYLATLDSSISESAITFKGNYQFARQDTRFFEPDGDSGSYSTPLNASFATSILVGFHTDVPYNIQLEYYTETITDATGNDLLDERVFSPSFSLDFFDNPSPGVYTGQIAPGDYNVEVNLSYGDFRISPEVPIAFNENYFFTMNMSPVPEPVVMGAFALFPVIGSRRRR